MGRPQQELSTIPTRRQHTATLSAARQQQRNKKIEDTHTHYIMYSNFKSYHHLLIASGASTHVCPKDYAPDLPLRPCGESVPQLYTVTSKKIPVYGIKYVPYKQDNFRIMMPYYVCDVKYPILSASRLLDRGCGLDFTPRHCTGQQQAHLIRHSGLFYLRAEKIRIRHLPNDYRQWKIHCCDSTYRENSTTTRTNCTTHSHRPRTTTDPWWKH